MHQGFEVIKQLLIDQPNPYKFILGVRDPVQTKPEFDNLKYDTTKHDISLHKVDFANMKEVKGFAQQALDKLGKDKDKLETVMLNHAIAKDGKGPALNGTPFGENYFVNHLCEC